jgi:hypothetical protein
MAFTVRNWGTNELLTDALLEDMETRLSAYTDSRATAAILGAASGGDDAPALNTFMAANPGAYFRGIPGQTYKIGTPLILPSKSVFDVRGCGIKFLNTAIHTNMLRNAAVAPVTTAADVATSVGSSVVTSATLAAAATVGQMLAVVGAGPVGGDGGGAIWLYGQVQSVVGNNITLSGNVNGVAATNALTGATGYLFNRDSNITILGGTWDTGANWIDPNARSADWKLTGLLRLRRIDGLRVSGLTLAGDEFTSGKGGVFGVYPGDCSSGVIDNIRGAGVGTCVQGDGPLRNLVVRDISGYTQDDLVAFGPVGASLTDMEGDIVDVRVDNLNAENAWTAAKAFSGAGSNGAVRLCDVRYNGVHGNTQRQPCLVVDYPNSNGGLAEIEFTDVTATPGVSGGVPYPQVDILTRAMRRVKVAAEWPVPSASFNLPPTGGVLHVGGGATDGLMEVIADLTPRGTGAASIGLYINDSNYNAGGYKLINMSRYEQLDTGLTNQGIQIETNVPIDRLAARDWVKNGGGILVWNNWSAPIKTVEISDGRLDANTASSKLYEGSTEKAGLSVVLKLSNVYLKSATNGVRVLHAITVLMEGVEYDSSALFCTAQGTNGTARVQVAPSCKFNNSKVAVGPGAAQVVSCVSTLAGVGADLSKLTGKTDGDICWNTNAAIGDALGIYVYRTGGTGNGWKHLYSGVTY